MASEAVKAARGLIGRSSEPESRPPVLHEEILRYAYAVDDRRPAYLDEDAALVGAHGGIIAPAACSPASPALRRRPSQT